MLNAEVGYETEFEICLKEMDSDTLRFRINDRFYAASVSTDEKGQGYVSLEGHIFNVKRLDVLIETDDYASGASGDGDNSLFAPMLSEAFKTDQDDIQPIESDAFQE